MASETQKEQLAADDSATSAESISEQAKASQATESDSQAKDQSATHKPKPATLSPSQRFRIYNNNLKAGLKNGLAFTDRLDQLTETSDTDELLASATALFTFHLDTAFVTFPHQYSAADYYLLFMGRLLELHRQAGITLSSAAEHEELSLTVDALGDQHAFKFVLVGGQNGGAFFTDKHSGLHLFYMNLERQQVRFNSKAFTDLFAIELADQPVEQRMTAIKTLILFAKDLEQDYDFSADYNLLETDNQARYLTKHADLPAGTVDKLFVASADSHYMLQNAPSGQGAMIELADGTVFGIANAGDDNAPKWVITVTDKNDAISLMAILLNYDFIRQWYLANRDDLEIQSDPLIFA